jgi:peptidoglycan/LPS O-acetylase OafA/YrhL
MSDGFVNRPMSIALDLVRAGAALAVLVGHAAQLRLYRGPWPFEDMQHEAVVVFFVLSGLVIVNSVERKRLTLRDYAVARTARILPVSLFAIAFSLAAFAVAATFSSNPLPASDYDHLTARVVMSLLFLSETRLGLGTAWNSPYWSLCYEVWYYALFAAAFYLRGRRRTVWLAILALAAGLKVLLLLPIWLMGVWLARAGARYRPGPLAAFGCLAAGLALAALANLAEQPAERTLIAISGLGRPDYKFSAYVLTDVPLGVAVTLCFLGLRPLADMAAGALQRCERPIRYAAGLSFTLYMLHWPILRLLGSLSVSAGDSLVLFAGLLLAICVFCALVASVIERKDFVLRRAIVGLRPTMQPA